MATRTQSRSSKAKKTGNSSSERSAFSWGDNAGTLIGAALAGAGIAFAANFGRKFMVQAMSGATGDWDEILTTEHDMTKAIFDKMLATDQSQTWKRSMLLMQLRHAMDKHAYEEEMVVYPALREANEKVTADELETEHGHMKTFLFELGEMKADAPDWLEKVRQFRDLAVEHMEMEEHEVFPRFKDAMTEEQSAKITSMVNKDGFWMA